MKYILINIKNFIKNETTIFFLCILCIFFSSIVVNFAFGFYHQLEQKKLDDMSGIENFQIEFVDESRSVVTKGELLDILLSLDEEVLRNCSISMDGHLEQYSSDEPVIDNHLVLFMEFSIKNGKITVASIGGSNLAEGRYFTAEQIENGEYVCIIPPQDMGMSREEEQFWYDKFKMDSEGFCTIDGKKYTPIGTTIFSFSLIPIVPITTVDDNCFVKYISFYYDNPLTRYQYNEISKAVTAAYGDVAVVDQLDIKDADSQRFYNTLIVLAVLLALFAGVVLSMLYQYIILQRKKNLTIYRLCGISKGKAVRMYLAECLLLTVTVYCISVLIYEYIILPYLAGFFEYITASYSLKVYAVMGAIYTATVLCVLVVIIIRQIKNNIANELRGI